jgi:hypothetical protein
VEHRAGDPKFLAHFFLRGITLHTFQYHFEFVLRRITLSFRVHSIQYLSLLLCLLYQVLDNPSPLGDREETASPFAFRFCLAEKESLHIPQGLRDAQACGEQVETKPEWNQERHDESEAGNPTCERWNPITLPVIGRRSIFAVEKQREVSQWNLTPAFKARFCVNRTLPS